MAMKDYLILHYPLDGNGTFGNENMIEQSMFHSAPWTSATWEEFDGKYSMIVNPGTVYNATSKGTTSYFPAVTYEENTQYTFSFWYNDSYRTDGKTTGPRFGFKYTDDTVSNVNFGSPKEWEFCQMTSAADKTVAFVRGSYGNGGKCAFSDMKIEKGTQATLWMPNHADLPGYSETTIYDISGNGHHGLAHNITLSADSPRYRACSVFNGSSWIKVEDNDWMVQGMPQITINLWAYHTNWANRPNRLFSCTESGGFNLESGNDGHYRFPMQVYTKADKSSHAYKYSSNELAVADLAAGWHMFTFMLDETGNAVYVDGEFHSHHGFTNYGIYFNRNARLYLGCEANTANPSSPYFSGMMSDFRMYSTALSASEVRELYRMGGTL